MELKEIIDYIFQNGLATVCVAYMIYFQNTTMKKMSEILNSMNARLAVIEDRISAKEKGDK